MGENRKTFGEYLRRTGLIDEAAIERALDFQQRSTPSFETLVRAYGLLSDTEILDLLTLANAEKRSFEDLATERGVLSAHDAESLRTTAADYHLPLGETLVLLGLLERKAMESSLRAFWVEAGPLGDLPAPHPRDPSQTAAAGANVPIENGAPAGKPGETSADRSAGPEPAQRQLSRLKTLATLFREVGESRKRGDTLRHILDAALHCVPCDCAFVATVDAELNIKVEEIFETQSRLPTLTDVTDQVVDLEQNHDRGIYRHVARVGTSYRTGDVTSDEHYIPGWEGVNSNLTVPISDPHGTVVGVLALESVAHDAFTDEDETYLETLAAYAGIAMDRAGQSERREKEGRILWRFGHCMREVEKGVVTTEGTRRVLEQVLDLCLEEVEAKQGFIALKDPAEDQLHISVVKGEKLLPTDERPSVIPMGEGITGQSAAAGHPLVSGDVDGHDGFIPIFDGMRSELAVPLIYLNEVIGVLNIESRKRSAFEAGHVDYCARIAETFAPLVQAAQFYDFTKDKFGKGIQLVGNSIGMAKLKEILLPAARSEATIMLVGESGTGKEYITKHIHFNSRRRTGPFEVISCTNTQAELVESELFGHKAGSFTGAIADKVGLFELADGGTVFLDEIGDLPLGLQGKLLRVLQEGTIRRIGDTQTHRVDVRVVTATNRNLARMVEDGTFREDLYYRLDQISITVPPLRERREDILLLTDHFVKKYATIERKEIEGLTEDALGLLWRRDWRGNVRQLEYFVYKLVIYSSGPAIRGSDVRRVAKMFNVQLRSKISTKLEPELLRTEILMALNATRTKKRLFKARATRYLGWDKNTLAQKMSALDIE